MPHKLALKKSSSASRSRIPWFGGLRSTKAQALLPSRCRQDRFRRAARRFDRPETDQATSEGGPQVMSKRNRQSSLSLFASQERIVNKEMLELARESRAKSQLELA